jgi:hypothetical protein
MTTGSFEVANSPHLLSGRIEADVYDPNGVAPTNIIQIDDDWLVRIKWALEGTLKSMVCGTWCLHVDLESIGKGPELSLPDDSYEIEVPLNPCGDGYYSYDFLVKKGVVTARHCSTPYKLVTTITYKNACGRPGPMAGFVEGGILQFYNPGDLNP